MQNLQSLFKRALILAPSDGHANIQKSILRSIGMRSIATYTSGVRFLQDIGTSAKSNFDRKEIIFCFAQLTDISAFDLMHVVKLNPYLLHQPFIGLASSSDELIAFREAGFTQVLIIPFKPIDLEPLIISCAKFEAEKRNLLVKYIEKNKDKPLQTFKFDAELDYLINEKQVSANEVKPTSLYEEGKLLARNGDYKRAIPLLAKACLEKKNEAEALVALATIYKIQESPDLEAAHLSRAMKVYAQRAQKGKVREVAIEYYKRFPKRGNPLASEIDSYFQSVEIESLIDILFYIDDIYPLEDQYENLIKATLASPFPLAVSKELIICLELKKPVMAHDIRPRIESEIKSEEKKKKYDAIKNIFKKKGKKVSNSAEFTDPVQDDRDFEAKLFGGDRYDPFEKKSKVSGFSDEFDTSKKKVVR